MPDTLLCLNSEWRGCESPILESGSRRLAAELYGTSTFLDLAPTECGCETRDGVFALDSVVEGLGSALEALRRQRPERVFTIGGTCGAEAAPVAYLNERYGGRLGVVWFDAHGDMNTPGSSPSGHFHGMVLRTLLGEGPSEVLARVTEPLDSANVVLAGVRDLDAGEERHIEVARLRVVRDWSEATGRTVVAALKDAAVGHVYIHVDVDVLDPRCFDDALFSVPGGPTLEQVAGAIRDVGEAFDVVGVGVVEYCGRTPDSASRLCGMLAEAGVWPLASAPR